MPCAAGSLRPRLSAVASVVEVRVLAGAGLPAVVKESREV